MSEANGKIVHNPERPQLHTEELDALPFASDIYKRDLEIGRYNVPFLLHPFISFYTTRGCPALCTFCMWPQTLSGHAWRTRSTDNVAREVKQALEYFPQMKEIFFEIGRASCRERVEVSWVGVVGCGRRRADDVTLV